MKYYTETISADLAEKLKEKGMPIEMQPLYAQEAPNARGIVKAGVGLGCPSYASCFDWLMEKGKEVEIFYVPARGGYVYGIAPFPDYTEGGQSWHEAANAAIEKALTLI